MYSCVLTAFNNKRNQSTINTNDAYGLYTLQLQSFEFNYFANLANANGYKTLFHKLSVYKLR